MVAVVTQSQDLFASSSTERSGHVSPFLVCSGLLCGACFETFFQCQNFTIMIYNNFFCVFYMIRQAGLHIHTYVAAR